MKYNSKEGKISLLLFAVGSVEFVVALCLFFEAMTPTKALGIFLAVAALMMGAAWRMWRDEVARVRHEADLKRRQKNREEMFQTWLHCTKISPH